MRARRQLTGKQWAAGGLALGVAIAYAIGLWFLSPKPSGLAVFSSDRAVFFVAPFVVLFLSTIGLITYRFVAEERFESATVAVYWTGLTQAGTLLITGISRAQQQEQYLAPILVMLISVLILLFLLALVHLGLTRARRKHTEQRVTDILMGTKDATVSVEQFEAFANLGKAFLEEDYFPNSFPQNISDVKANNRVLFFRSLPDSLFDKTNIAPDDFLVVKLDTAPSSGSATPGTSGTVIFPRVVDGTWHWCYAFTAFLVSLVSLFWMSVYVTALITSPTPSLP